MPLSYKVVGKKHPQQPNGVTKYYAQTVLKGEIDLYELGKEIAHLCSVKQGDIMTVLQCFADVVPHKLAEGYIVRMGGLGNLRPSLSSEGYDTPQQVSVHSIKMHKVRFRPGKGTRKVMTVTPYKKA